MCRAAQGTVLSCWICMSGKGILTWVLPLPLSDFIDAHDDKTTSAMTASVDFFMGKPPVDLQH